MVIMVVIVISNAPQHYIIDQRIVNGYHSQVLTTLEFAPLLCYLLDIQATEKMKPLEVKRIHESKKEL